MLGATLTFALRFEIPSWVHLDIYVSTRQCAEHDLWFTFAQHLKHRFRTLFDFNGKIFHLLPIVHGKLNGFTIRQSDTAKSISLVFL